MARIVGSYAIAASFAAHARFHTGSYTATYRRVSSMEDQNVYDVIVIGAGPVGQNVADRARAADLRVAVVERELVGGECSYWACVPSKALLRPVIAVADARRIDGTREAVTGSLDTAGVFGRAFPNSCIPRPSLSQRRFRSNGSGTRFRASRRSPRCGFVCWRSTATPAPLRHLCR
jgi:hypothetical protein